MINLDAKELPEGKRLPSLTEALIPIISIGLLLGIGYGLFEVEVEVLLLTGAVIAALVGKRLGYTYHEMQDGINKSIYKSMTALLIVNVVGSLIAAWIACGTIPMLIYWGLHIIMPEYFLVTACILCSIVSIITGTSWGTVGTIGVALMGIGTGLGIDPAPAAGAIVAGSFFGDKISPFSDTTNLAPAAARSNIYDHIKHTLWTTSPAFLLGLIVYQLLGGRAEGEGDTATFDAISTGLTENFVITGMVGLVLLIPPVITLGSAILKKPVIPSMLLSCLVAWFLAVGIQPHATPERGQKHPYYTADTPETPPDERNNLHERLTLKAWPVVFPLHTMIEGYRIKTDVPEVNSLLNRGGMMSMMDTLLIALVAFAFGGIITETRMLDVILVAILKFATSVGRLVLSTSLCSILVALMTGSSYLSILIPGELFGKAFRDRGLAAKNLSRTTEDSGTVVVPLIPWSIAGVFMAATLDVPVIQYAPWAVMCYTGVFFAIIYGFTGFKIAPRTRDDETEAGS
jgi:NhaC family Na+:H+ antiporter